MVQCITCGAPLRPTARFCNVCGARQTPFEMDAHLDQPASPAENESADASGGRVKRPPRVERAVDDQPSATPGGRIIATTVLPEGFGEEATRLAAAAASSSAAAESSSVATSEAGDAPGVPDTHDAHDANGAQGAHDVAVEDAETVESRVVLPRYGAQGSPSVPLPEFHQSANGAAHADGPLWDTAGLPWPLPASIIVGGRYRVEALVSAAPDEQGENVYRVSDLQGYERCWSCGTTYGASGASDRYCRECGADMLAREFTLYERRATQQDGAETATADAATDSAPQAGVEVAAPDAEAAGEAPADGATESPTPGDAAEERTFTQGARSYRVVPKVAEPSPFPQGARVLIGAATDVGASRSGERNEDSLAALVLNLGHDSHLQPLALGIVADGLGGHVNGQDASRLVTRMLVEHVIHTAAIPLIGLPADAQATAEGLDSVLREGARLANAALCASNSETDADMGSTLVAALVFDGTAYVINAGDSRCYLYTEGEIRRITSDHSLVEQLIAGNLIAPEDRYTHPQRNQIYRSLGDEPEMQFDLFTQKLQPGMRLLLCSDGLWEMVRDDELARILGESSNPQDACDQLMRAANANGGEDNVTAVVIEVHA